MNLVPSSFSKPFTLDTDEEILKPEEDRISLCMECGCCSFVCPANRPIVQNNRLAKAVLRKYKARRSTLK